MEGVALLPNLRGPSGTFLTVRRGHARERFFASSNAHFVLGGREVRLERLLSSNGDRRVAAGEPDNEETLLAAIREGAALRVRPKAMTLAVVMAGLLPILWGTGTGSEVMTRIAAPMVGGMVTAPLLSMLVIPAAWYLLHQRRHMVALAAVFFAA